MPTQEELNAAQVELDIANDNYAQMANKYNQFQDMFKLYANATPETQAKAKDAMVRALDEFENLKLNMYTAEDRIQQAQNRVNSYNEIIANQPVQQTVTRSGYNSGRSIPPTNELDWWWNEPDGGFVVREWWKPVYNDKWEIVWEQWDAIKLNPYIERPSSFTGRKAATAQPITGETWEDIYNSWWRNEFKKWFNNAVVDDLVMPVASAFWASDDTLWILSELKIPATEREMASKYYSRWWMWKDAADAYLQYAAMKWLTSIPELLGLSKWGSSAYTVANSARWIYNRPGAREAVNRAWSNYSPAYLNKATSVIKQIPKTSATSSVANTPAFKTLTPTQTNNFWKYVDANLEEPVLSTVKNFTNWYL